MVDGAAVQEFCHFGIEFRGGKSGLEHVGQNQHLLFVLNLRAACHEVEGDVKGGGVGVVGVVDERAVADALDDLQAHGDRLQTFHSTCNFLCTEVQTEQDGEAVDAVHRGGFVGEGNGHGGFRTVEAIGDSCAALQGFHRGDEEGGTRIPARPRQTFPAQQRGGDTLIDHGVIGAIDQDLCVLEERKFLVAFFFDRLEVLLVGRTDVGHDANRRLDDGTQGCHLTGLRDAGFEDANLAVFSQETDAERHAHL